MIKIREMQSDDIEGALAIWGDVFHKEPRSARGYLPLFLEKNPGSCFIAEVEGKIVGVILGSFNGRAGYLNRIAVKRDFQGREIASELIKSSVRVLRNAGAPSIFLHCNPKLEKSLQKRFNIS